MIMHAVSRRRRVWALSPVYLLVAGLFAHAAPADAQVSFNVLYEFSGGQDGAAPRGLIEGTDGNFYGTTFAGVHSIVDVCGRSRSSRQSHPGGRRVPVWDV